MNGRNAKAIRRQMRKESLKMGEEFKTFINSLKLGERLNLAWRVIWGKL